MYFFHPFNNDPKNPWTLSNARINARWTGVSLLAFGLIMAGYSALQDYAFVPGTTYANANFVKVTGSKPDLLSRNASTNYYGLYRYTVDGHIYYISQTDDESSTAPAQFKPTINVAYKKMDPAQATIVYGDTLQADARSSIVDWLIGGVAGYTIIYLICVPIMAIQNRKRYRPS